MKFGWADVTGVRDQLAVRLSTRELPPPSFCCLLGALNKVILPSCHFFARGQPLWIKHSRYTCPCFRIHSLVGGSLLQLPHVLNEESVFLICRMASANVIWDVIRQFDSHLVVRRGAGKC